MREVMSELFKGASKSRVFQMPELSRPLDETPASRRYVFLIHHRTTDLLIANRHQFNAALQHFHFTLP